MGRKCGIEWDAGEVKDVARRATPMSALKRQLRVERQLPSDEHVEVDEASWASVNFLDGNGYSMLIQ